jgi:hypothetical protein
MPRRRRALGVVELGTQFERLFYTGGVWVVVARNKRRTVLAGTGERYAALTWEWTRALTHECNWKWLAHSPEVRAPTPSERFKLGRLRAELAEGKRPSTPPGAAE